MLSFTYPPVLVGLLKETIQAHTHRNTQSHKIMKDKFHNLLSKSRKHSEKERMACYASASEADCIENQHPGNNWPENVF